MKQISAKTKIIVAIIILIIVVGAAVIGTKGFNFDLRNQASQMAKIYIKSQFEIEDMRQITNEVFGKEPVLIQKVEVYEDQVAIITKEITDEQKTSLTEKINEKYELDLKSEDIEIQNIPHTRLRDLIKPYILPLIISTIAILLYTTIRFHKLGICKTILRTGGIVLLTEIILFALIAITRFPVGRYTLPLVLFTYLITMLIVTIELENKLNDKNVKE